MKKIILILAVVFTAITVNAQPPKGKAKVGDTYGSKVDTKDAINASELPAMLAKNDTLKVKVKGKALASCASKGCWMTLQVDDKNAAFIKMKDYAFFVPIAIANKNVVIDGVVYMKTTSVEELKHYAEDAKKSQAEIDAITEPKQEIKIMATGIVVVE